MRRLASVRLYFTALLMLFSVMDLAAATGRYRLSYRDDPSTTVVVGWEQLSGSSPVVYYDTLDHGTDHTLYSWTKVEDRAITHKGMDNRFARLSGLVPNKAYYFLIRDSEGNSARFWFRTIPDTPNERLSIVAGGDSRSDPAARRNANILVSKLRPHAIFFGGDYTNGNTSFEWQAWFDDWQFTISPDGRMYPIVATRGNHEGSNADVYNLFDVISPDVYYALNFGGTLLRSYTMNTEISQTGTQATWLANDLATWDNGVTWKTVQYHRPCRPHNSTKSDQTGVYDFWVPEFEDHGVNLVVECDAHVVKRTWPILKGTGAGSDNGFYRDDSLGITYVGEGTWAPLRVNDDDKSWTRNSGSFNSFKWLWIDECEIQLRTLLTSNAGSVGTLTEANLFTLPPNVQVWTPTNGDVLSIRNVDCAMPGVSITAPTNGQYFITPQALTLTADAWDVAPGNVTIVEFFVNGISVGTDNSVPYELPWTIPADGYYQIRADATDNEGYTTVSNPVNISVGVVEVTSQVDASSDDAEESNVGLMYLNSSDLELVWDGSDQWVGMRFNNIDVPQGATVENAYIQFTADETNSGPTSLVLHGEAVDNSNTFGSLPTDISGRDRTLATTGWNPLPWTVIGENGLAQRTPDLSGIIQEIVDRNGWVSGNSLSILVSGTGERVAESFDGVPGAAPVLVITYRPDESTGIPEIYPLTATETESGIRLLWQVEAVTAPLTFTVQRSLDGRNFENLTHIPASLSTQYKWYQLLDSAAPEGLLYYRISALDEAGDIRLSETVEIFYAGSSLLQIYPQPADEEITFLFQSMQAFEDIRLYDLSGKVVALPPILSADGHHVRFDLRDMTSGMYILQFRNRQNALLRRRVIIEH